MTARAGTPTGVSIDPIDTTGSNASPSRGPSCPICGEGRFGPGPKGRMSPAGTPPRCLGCGALERHRAQRVVMNAVRDLLCPGRSALQFSPDPSVDPAWFADHTLSVFGTASGLDLAAIDRRDGSVDAVICNHVLEHVEDDRTALAELARILGPAGWLFLSVPDPIRMNRTLDYGRARADKHGHYRVYGPDVADRIVAAMSGFSVLATTPTDPVTGEGDRAYLAIRNAALAEKVSDRLMAAAIAVEMVPPRA